MHTVTFLHGFVLFHNPKGIPIYFQTIENDAKTLPCAHSLKMPPFLFFFLFFFGVESWAAAHGLHRCTVYRLLSEPMSTRLLNSISSRICRQNTQFNMYTTTSKQQEGCTFKDSHTKCFITTNFDKFHREAFARGGESR